jgi:C4-type Zn-finger protein
MEKAEVELGDIREGPRGESERCCRRPPCRKTDSDTPLAHVYRSSKAQLTLLSADVKLEMGGAGTSATGAVEGWLGEAR